jgi:hypothetical protein
VDRRHHCNNEKCDAVLETGIQSVKKAKVTSPVPVCTVPDITFLRKTTVEKAVQAAQVLSDPITIWLYDPGSISNDEVKEYQK